MRFLIVVVLHLCAALVPLLVTASSVGENGAAFQGWPTAFEGKPLTPLPLTVREHGFTRGFPGRIGRFSDGSREIIFRYLQQPSRRLHPSADCLRGSGYRVESLPLRSGQDGRLWGCIVAERDGPRYRVCERIDDAAGNSWYDVSSWFWAALLGKSQGPWWAVTVAERW